MPAAGVVTIRKILLALLCLGVAACVATYREVENGAATAVIQFEKGYSTGLGFGSSASQEYSIVDDTDALRRAAFLYVDKQ